MAPARLLLLAALPALLGARQLIVPVGGGGDDDDRRRRQPAAPSGPVRPAPAGAAPAEAGPSAAPERGPLIVPGAGGAQASPPAPPLRSQELIERVQSEQRVEIVPGQEYWDRVGRVRFVHYVDPFGAHWYGFPYYGSSYYWARLHGGYWWWHDPYYGGWRYWDDGGWRGAGAAAAAPAAPRGGGYAAPAFEGRSYASPDGSRTVQIAGAERSAFLYDTSGERPRYLGRLAEGAERARFSDGRILLDMRDGTFAIFGPDGKELR